ncbi:MAG: YibE/F family protein [Bacillota bacterium]|nr:YibE/F family protein [Bacillota bacterium]
MSAPIVLLIILFALMTLIGGKRGVKSFFTLLFNFVTFLILIIFIYFGVDPIKVTIAGCIIITCITLFYINGVNKKTVSSLISVLIVVLLTVLITYNMGTEARIQGFGYEQMETVAYLSIYVHLNFAKILVCQILIGLLGAIIDVSISISSSMNEVYKNDPSITKNNLLKSGINIGKDILGTMTNTLIFAFIGGFMAFIIYFTELHTPLADIMNRKVFCSEVFQILCSGIGIILIIPVTAIIMAVILMRKQSDSEKEKTADEIR